MATSGTVATTVIDTALVIDHAVRRCGKEPSTLTPENIQCAKDNLYLILTSLINKGINLWCVEKKILAFYEHQANYTMPAGTVDVLNAMYRTAVDLDPTVTHNAANYTADFTDAVAVKTVGIKFATSGSYNLILEYSTDGATWSTAYTIGATTEVANKWKWYDVDPGYSAQYFRVRETVAVSLTLSDIIWAKDTYEVPMERMSRDTYTDLPNKNQPGKPYQYMYDKQTTPIITVWPLPDDPEAQLVIWRQRQVQDVGTMVQTLEIPERWFQAVIWELSAVLAFELPGVTPERLVLCEKKAAETTKEAGDNESDSAPIYVQPNISCYTR